MAEPESIESRPWLDFELPAELEAHEPPEARGLARDQVRLLVSHLGSDALEHGRFTDLPNVLRPGDLVVANDSATVAAALPLYRNDGSAVMVHVSTHIQADLWVVEPRHITPRAGEVLALTTTVASQSTSTVFALPGSSATHAASEVLALTRSSAAQSQSPVLALTASSPSQSQSAVVALTGSSAADSSPGVVALTPSADSHTTLRLLAPYSGSRRLWVAQFAPQTDVAALLRRRGRPIAYPYVTQPWPLHMYQTVYAGPPGSAEMPSAGRAFSPDVLEQLQHRAVQFATLTLHTGVASLEGHERPYAEEYWIPSCTAAAVQAARVDGRRVIAVGTTVVRALESAADAGAGEVVASHAWTDLVI
ncbi:MAG TPA: S-adenosylmethionine:tRNA ribosyltransferase-isomerase, partial [Chloroflexota bacterium]|nr:S-adenosylmethionine:tRNA ribosyltransferase-isomerase [Chloroflexota bacterium]